MDNGENREIDERGQTQQAEQISQQSTETEQQTEQVSPERDDVQPEDAQQGKAETPEGVEQDIEKPKTLHEKIAYTTYDLVSIFATAIVAIMLVFTFVFRFVGVIGPSMEPTLVEDDWLAVTAFLSEPKAGDIVIITQPNAFDEPIVKRVVATSGQSVDIRDGHVYINGEKLTETYISPFVITERENLDSYPLTVPEGQVFVLGDNRPHSTDSRSSLVGLIDNNYLLGKVVFRILPFGNFKVGSEYDYSSMN